MKKESKDHGSWWAVAIFLLLIALGVLHAATQPTRHTSLVQNPQYALKTLRSPSTTAATPAHIEVHQK